MTIKVFATCILWNPALHKDWTCHTFYISADESREEAQTSSCKLALTKATSFWPADCILEIIKKGI